MAQVPLYVELLGMLYTEHSLDESDLDLAPVQNGEEVLGEVPMELRPAYVLSYLLVERLTQFTEQNPIIASIPLMARLPEKACDELISESVELYSMAKLAAEFFWRSMHYHFSKTAGGKWLEVRKEWRVVASNKDDN